ncbi:hypothetical protein BIW11_11304 [Tropilaelaps mercedesae]|uniref:Uncharacterized protein n=1 Tax=Tropilaelaps mercedesae TaxID=418985 RepID=A0A1V9XBN9_9ACAR|nr:hypothetical protein BIW11_11304 [Tropilaelaps mercedesae]
MEKKIEELRRSRRPRIACGTANGDNACTHPMRFEQPPPRAALFLMEERLTDALSQSLPAMDGERCPSLNTPPNNDGEHSWSATSSPTAAELHPIQSPHSPPDDDEVPGRSCAAQCALACCSQAMLGR